MSSTKDIEATKKLIDFIEKSPTCYHVISNITADLETSGYKRLEESSDWDLKSGGKYYVTRNLSSVLAFEIPDNTAKGFLICAAHSDSPSFKLKANPEMDVEGMYVKLDVEKYGGMIMSTWLDRPLSVAGKILVETGAFPKQSHEKSCNKPDSVSTEVYSSVDGKSISSQDEISFKFEDDIEFPEELYKGSDKSTNCIESRLVNIDRDFCVIPNLAIHMNREINNGYKYNPQKDMLPLIGNAESKGKLFAEIADIAEVKTEQIIGSDLFLYNREHGSVWGADNEYFSIGRIDDQQCAYCAKEAFIKAENNNMIKVLAVFDNEEVGSGTKQGALSTFLGDTIERIRESLNLTASEIRKMFASSMMLSADNGHALHPNNTDKADPVNRPVMNGGIVIKYNANQKYTTDSVSEALLKAILNKAGIPYQEFFNRSDIAGGSTLGNLSNEQVSLNTVDIGAAELSMHSSFETGGVKDTAHLINGITAFYNTTIKCVGDGKYTLS